MKKSMVSMLTGLSMAALLAGGCANNDVVKKEEPVVPAVAVEKTVPAKPVEQAVPAAQPVETPKVTRVEQPVQAAPEKPAVVEIKLETAYFDFDKSELRQDARDVLSKNAEVILKALAGAKVQIEGHCDERGSAEYNMALGERRAKSAQKYLTTLGVKTDNLPVISYGKEKPAVAGNDEAAWAKNRRAEFVIVK